MKNILITGGAGFIGSHLVKFFVENYPKYTIINLDSLTYAGNLDNLKEIENKSNYKFIREDICNLTAIKEILEKEKINSIIHLAAESHVDRSITDPFSFAKTNVLGTLSLLEAAKNYWNSDFKNKLFYHVSTDEVYGSLGSEGLFTEKTAYDPHSPYSASKASSDHFVRAFHDTYNLPIVISNCSNNYGPNQYPEKLIPLFINNIINNIPIPIYGNGENIRDWLYVEDHVSAIDLIFHNSKIGKTYNIGGNNEITNNQIADILIKKLDEKLKRTKGESLNLIKYIEDRLGHDKRYAIDSSKIKSELNWSPKHNFEKGIDKTIDWYIKRLS
ncbi:MAG: dTDP-glucose 4,6-dehydratase [Bacteroidetes bacterium]|nr:dTDP-glucose 4,6-dehydratase [Bacteroidota bacterium]MDA1019865.1 dTDP-glucose 4,6-dehydratase [Bacteroidota bacterium]|tara:strand:- start:14 stop:1003 length:990 start_codon:yes stop_codon:yes gene_type:complete